QGEKQATLAAHGERTDGPRHLPAGGRAGGMVEPVNGLAHDIDVVERLLLHVPHGTFSDEASGRIEAGDFHLFLRSGWADQRGLAKPSVEASVGLQVAAVNCTAACRQLSVTWCESISISRLARDTGCSGNPVLAPSSAET